MGDNDDMDALGSILSWDEEDENEVTNEANSITTSTSHMDALENQNTQANAYFIAQLRADIAAHNTNQNIGGPSNLSSMQSSSYSHQQHQQQIQQQIQSQHVQQQQNQQQHLQQSQVIHQQQQQQQTQHEQTRVIRHQTPQHSQQQQQQAAVLQQQQPIIQTQPQNFQQQSHQIVQQQLHQQQEPQAQHQQMMHMQQPFVTNYFVPNQQQTYTQTPLQPQQNSTFIQSDGFTVLQQAGNHGQTTFVPNMLQQVQQPLSSDFIRAIQQQMASQVPLQNQQERTQGHITAHLQPQQQQTLTIPNGINFVTVSNASNNPSMHSQPTHVAVTPAFSSIPNGNNVDSSQSNDSKRPSTSIAPESYQRKQKQKKKSTPDDALFGNTPDDEKPKLSQSVVSCSSNVSNGETENECGSQKSTAKPGKKSTERDETGDKEMSDADKAKAKASRDRNREHARNTRLRKKAYLEKLKTTVDDLCKERDTLVTERAGKASLLVEVHNTRIEVLMSFFSIRSSWEKRRNVWSSILDESRFQCVLPITPYRSFPASEVQISKCQRTILGIDGMMSDTASLHVLLNSLINRAVFPDGKIQFRYSLISEDAILAGNQMMSRWSMTTTNAVELGARMEVSKQGMLCCKFSSAHTIIGMELMFDVMAFMLQLKQSKGSDSFTVIPNTTQTSQRPFTEPMIMTLSERPYTIVQVNRLWEEMTEYSSEEVVGKFTPRILQGNETSAMSVEELMDAIRYKRPCQIKLLNYTKNGKKFFNCLTVYPLSTDSKITHYIGLTEHYKVLDQDTKDSKTSEDLQTISDQMRK